MTYFQSQSLNQLNVKTCMHTYSFDLYLHLSHLILIHNTHILINQWEFKKIKHRFFFTQQRKLKFSQYFFFWIRGNPTPWKAHFVGPDERVKPYKRCKPWLELETCCADLKPFTITLRPLGTKFSQYPHTLNTTLSSMLKWKKRNIREWQK
jgi:hypothetical protein